MAIKPSDRYPGQTDAAAGWPYGKARNKQNVTDTTGTPLEKDWVSDWFGFQQAILDEANIDPSGDPDKVGTSDLVDAIHAINPIEIGGTVSPSSQLIFNGDLHLASGTFESDADATFRGSFDVEGAATLTGQITASGADLTGAPTSVDDLSVDGTLSVTSLASFADDVSMDADLDVTGAAGLGSAIVQNDLDVVGNLSVDGTTLLSDTVTFSVPFAASGGILGGGPYVLLGAGHVRYRVVTLPDDQDTSVGPDDGDIFYVPIGNTPTTDRTITLKNASEGERLDFVYEGSANGYVFEDAAGNQILHNGSQVRMSSTAERMAFIYVDGTWRLHTSLA